MFNYFSLCISTLLTRERVAVAATLLVLLLLLLVICWCFYFCCWYFYVLLEVLPAQTVDNTARDWKSVRVTMLHHHICSSCNSRSLMTVMMVMMIMMLTMRIMIPGVQNKTRRTKCQMMNWYFVRLLTIIFISTKDDFGILYRS